MWEHVNPWSDKNYDDDKGDNDADQNNGNNDDEDQHWLEAAGGRDDVNPGVDRLYCSVPLNALLHYTASML